MSAENDAKESESELNEVLADYLDSLVATSHQLSHWEMDGEDVVLVFRETAYLGGELVEKMLHHGYVARSCAPSRATGQTRFRPITLENGRAQFDGN